MTEVVVLTGKIVYEAGTFSLLDSSRIEQLSLNCLYWAVPPMCSSTLE